MQIVIHSRGWHLWLCCLPSKPWQPDGAGCNEETANMGDTWGCCAWVQSEIAWTVVVQSHRGGRSKHGQASIVSRSAGVGTRRKWARRCAGSRCVSAHLYIRFSLSCIRDCVTGQMGFKPRCKGMNVLQQQVQCQVYWKNSSCWLMPPTRKWITGHGTAQLRDSVWFQGFSKVVWSAHFSIFSTLSWECGGILFKAAATVEDRGCKLHGVNGCEGDCVYKNRAPVPTGG
eukprot:6348844-Amphidinium_carterae.2